MRMTDSMEVRATLALLSTVVAAMSTCRPLQVPGLSNAVLQQVPYDEPTHKRAHVDHLEIGRDT